MTTQDILDQDLADYIAAAGGSVTPAIQHRIHCTDSNTAVAPACPGGSPYRSDAELGGLPPCVAGPGSECGGASAVAPTTPARTTGWCRSSSRTRPGA